VNLNDFDILEFGDKIGMCGAVLNDNNGVAYLCMFPKQPAPTKIESLVMDLEDWKKLLRQLDLQEAKVTVQNEKGELEKAILRKSQRTIEQRVSWAVFKRDHYHCRYCGADGVPLTVDHLILWEDGGPSIEDNLLSACRPCNKNRGDMSYAEWLHSPYYKKASRNLPMTITEANEKLVQAILLIPKRYEKRETRK
jgi:HNH endonuclease